MSYKKHKSPNFKNLWSLIWQHGNLSRLCFWSSSSPQLLCFSSSCQMRHVWLHSHSSKKKKKTKLPAFPIQRRRPARWFRWRRTGGLATCWSRRPPFSSSANKQMSLSAFFLRFLIFKSLVALAALYTYTWALASDWLTLEFETLHSHDGHENNFQVGKKLATLIVPLPLPVIDQRGFNKTMKKKTNTQSYII